METALQPDASRVTTQLALPFINSTIEVFTTMVGVKPVIVRPRLKVDSAATYDVSGVIGFSGEIIGSVVLSFQMEAACKLVAALAGMELAPDSPDFSDAIGELANMIAGSAKKNFGKTANIAVPTVIIGKNHMIGRLSGVPCILIPCSTPVGNFAVEVNIKPTA